MMKQKEPTAADMQALVRELQDAGMTAQEISEALEYRVSRRTIYRWSRGESGPQNTYDYLALRELAVAKRQTA